MCADCSRACGVLRSCPRRRHESGRERSGRTEADRLPVLWRLWDLKKDLGVASPVMEIRRSTS